MTSTLTTKIVGFLATLPLALTAFAAPGPSTSGSSTQDLSREASGLLVQLHQDAAGVRDSVDTLEEYNQDPLVIDWRADADTLDILRDQINQMDQILYRLQDIEKALPPEQQAEINTITPPMLETHGHHPSSDQVCEQIRKPPLASTVHGIRGRNVQRSGQN